MTFAILTSVIIGCAKQDRNHVIIDTSLMEIRDDEGIMTFGRERGNWSFGAGKEYFFDTLNLTDCWCQYYPDTLLVSIGYYSESGEYPEFKVRNEQFVSQTVFFSDFGEFEGEDSMYVPTDSATLTLNKINPLPGDSLIGLFYLKSDTIKYEGWNRTISFKGRFQCIVQEKD